MKYLGLFFLFFTNLSLCKAQSDIDWESKKIQLNQLNFDGNNKDSQVLSNFKIIDENVKYWNEDTLVRRKKFIAKFNPSFNWNSLNLNNEQLLNYIQVNYDLNELNRRYLQIFYEQNRAVYRIFKKKEVLSRMKTIQEITSNGKNADSITMNQLDINKYLDSTKYIDSLGLELKNFSGEFGLGSSFSKMNSKINNFINFDMLVAYKIRKFSVNIHTSFGISKFNESVNQISKDEKVDNVNIRLQLGYTILSTKKLRLTPSIGLTPSFLFPKDRFGSVESISPSASIYFDYSLLKVMNYRVPNILNYGRFYEYRIRTFFNSQLNNYEPNLSGIGYTVGIALLVERKVTRQRNK